ncbi:MAG: hypothetical protein ACI4BB_02650 [Coprococcus sp.]
MEERILNYLEMSEEQRENALKELKSIGFYPAYGKEKTMKKIMDKSVAGDMPQFYFVFRKEQLIGYMFIIGDTQKYRAFPWLAISNVDEVPMRVTRPLMEIQIEAWKNMGNVNMADYLRRQLIDYERGIGHRPENLCR